MTKTEYDYLQSELSKLIDKNRLLQKIPCDRDRHTYNKAVLDCKSRLHSYFCFHGEAGGKQE